MSSRGWRLLFAEPVENAIGEDKSTEAVDTSQEEDFNTRTTPSRAFQSKSIPVVSTTTQQRQRGVMSMSDIRDSGITCCCKTLRCVDAFVSGKHDCQELERQAEDLSRLTGRRAGLSWVTSMVPFTGPRTRRGGLGKAGHSLVCNRFFALAFRLSKSLIDNAKRSPCSLARASQSSR